MLRKIQLKFVIPSAQMTELKPHYNWNRWMNELNASKTPTLSIWFRPWPITILYLSFIINFQFPICNIFKKPHFGQKKTEKASNLATALTSISFTGIPWYRITTVIFDLFIAIFMNTNFANVFINSTISKQKELVLVRMPKMRRRCVQMYFLWDK